MEANRQIEFHRDLPQRIPMRIAEQWLSEGLGLSSEENTPMAHSGAAPHFFYCGLHIPEWREVIGSSRRESADAHSVCQSL